MFQVPDGAPLVGSIAFGLIDRGTNLIQVRPSSYCPMSCIFCSTDAGPKSRWRQAEYLVDLEPLIDSFKDIVRFKGEHRIEAHIDTVGDPFTYPRIVDLVQALSEVKGVNVISVQTHGPLLNEHLLDELSEAGLSRINLSIDALDPELARKLAGNEWYDVERVMELARYIVENTRIDLLIAPVWVPTINDSEMPKIIRFAIEIGAGKRWPPLGIQKYEAHRRGRRPPKVRAMRWREFYAQLRRWEREFGVKQILRRSDFGIHKRPALPIEHQVGEKLWVRVIGPGWLKGEVIAVERRRPRRIITVVGVNPEEVPPETIMRVEIIRNKHNIYLARPTP